MGNQTSKTSVQYKEHKACNHKRHKIITEGVLKAHGNLCPTCELENALIRHKKAKDDMEHVVGHYLNEHVIQYTPDGEIKYLTSAAFKQAGYVMNTWKKRKIDLENKLLQLEREAEEEAKWEKDHPEDAGGCSSSRWALDNYKSKATVKNIDDLRAPPKVTVRGGSKVDYQYFESDKPKEKPTHKKVSFDPSVVEPTGRHRAHYWRTGKQWYRPGRYACDSPEGYMDISQLKNIDDAEEVDGAQQAPNNTPEA